MKKLFLIPTILGFAAIALARPGTRAQASEAGPRLRPLCSAHEKTLALASSEGDRKRRCARSGRTSKNKVSSMGKGALRSDARLT
jgi:hypothetical protein